MKEGKYFRSNGCAVFHTLTKTEDTRGR